MHARSLIAFLMGAGLFAVVPYFDSEIPGEGEMGEILITVVLGLVVGATVVLVAGRWRAWSLALASAFAGALAAQVYYEVALEPPPRGGFELGSVAFGAFYAFVFSVRRGRCVGGWGRARPGVYPQKGLDTPNFGEHPSRTRLRERGTSAW